ncbi:MAG: MBL fold metallo-hydrolase [Parvularcula sp.]|jgi:phosphoribosyl 1,2-cyclic phosphate phosphodiesterase|nr:MBL fold metallo-hydrolase [Parvularcula sp.]
MKLRAIILGCGSSGGVPRIGGADGSGDWGDCDPSEPKNRRSRCSIAVQRAHADGSFDGELTTLLIDTSPDLREQLLRNRIKTVDAVAITHDHADQTHGIDDLRAVAIHRRARVPVWVDRETTPDLISRFRYCFEQTEGSGYPAVLEEKIMPSPGETFAVDGPSGPITVTPFLQKHGRIDSLGFRCGPIAYSADLDDVYAESWPVVEGVPIWIIDALQYKPHSSHLHLAKSLEFLKRAGTERGVLTNLHVVMDYRRLSANLPAGVEAAFDGMVVEAAE